MSQVLVSSEVGILTVLAAVCSLFFFLEKKTTWTLFNFFPPLLFIYLVPVGLSNGGVIPAESPLYEFMGDNLLPMFLTIMLLKVDVLATVRVMGRGLFVMLLGTAGVVLGAPVSYWLVRRGLEPDAWKGFGALAGSWIGGTGNMMAVGQMVELDARSPLYGYVVIADNAVYLIWLPIMLASKNLAKWFHAFTRVSPDRLKRLESAAKELGGEQGAMEMRHVLYLIFLSGLVTALAIFLSQQLDPITTAGGHKIVTANTYKILLVTIFGVALSFTPASKIPGSHAISLALVYLFVARMGAQADLSKLNNDVFWFLLGAYIWIFIHGAILLAGARLFRVDVHTAAISSAANIGGAASAPIVAAYHRPALVPVAILMALLGYAIGNPLAYLAALLCRWVAIGVSP